MTFKRRALSPHLQALADDAMRKGFEISRAELAIAKAHPDAMILDAVQTLERSLDIGERMNAVATIRRMISDGADVASAMPALNRIMDASAPQTEAGRIEDTLVKSETAACAVIYYLTAFKQAHIKYLSDTGNYAQLRDIGASILSLLNSQDNNVRVGAFEGAFQYITMTEMISLSQSIQQVLVRGVNDTETEIQQSAALIRQELIQRNVAITVASKERKDTNGN